MGATGSSFPDNEALVDSIAEMLSFEYRTERIFRLVDRGHFAIEPKERIYSDSAWRVNKLHLSAPTIYGHVLCGLDIRPGQSVLNIGSGTGYLSTIIGLLLGSNGVNHGIEVYESNVEFARAQVSSFVKTSDAVYEFDFCSPVFMVGNIFSLVPPVTTQSTESDHILGPEQKLNCNAHIEPPPVFDGKQWPTYDRIYVGSEIVTESNLEAILRLLKVGGCLIAPFNDRLLKIERPEAHRLETTPFLNVSFACLVGPSEDDPKQFRQSPARTVERLERLASRCIRRQLRRIITARHGGPPVIGRYVEVGEPDPPNPAAAASAATDSDHGGGGGGQRGGRGVRDNGTAVNPRRVVSFDTDSPESPPTQKREASDMDRCDSDDDHDGSPSRESSQQKRRCDESDSNNELQQPSGSTSATAAASNATEGNDRDLVHPLLDLLRSGHVAGRRNLSRISWSYNAPRQFSLRFFEVVNGEVVDGDNDDNDPMDEHEHIDDIIEHHNVHDEEDEDDYDMREASTSEDSDTDPQNDDSSGDSNAEDRRNAKNGRRKKRQKPIRHWVPPSYSYRAEMEELMKEKLGLDDYVRKLLLETI